MARKQTIIADFEESANLYIQKLRDADPEEAKKMAIANLISIGVLTKKGKPKKQIVKGDFFGW